MGHNGLDPHASGWSVQRLRALDAERFEALCHAYFEEAGYEVRRARSATGEALELTLFSKGEAKPALVAHCSRESARSVCVAAVRELLGAMSAYGLSEGVFVTPGTFSAEAQDFATVLRLRLIDGEEFVRFLRVLGVPADRG